MAGKKGDKAKENLIPIKKGQTDIPRLGGIAKAKKVREEKAFHQIGQGMMEKMKVPEAAKAKLIALGYEEDEIDAKLLFMQSLFNECLNGNVQAIERWIKLVGNDEDRKRLSTNNVNIDTEGDTKFNISFD